ncbi:DEAD/DEAH box helicase [Desulfocicer niacini]
MLTNTATSSRSELNVEIMPTQELRLTWESSPQRPGKRQQLLNQEIFNKYTVNEDQWLLFLGCSDAGIALEPSLDFFRHLARTFVESLKKMPALEEIRDQSAVPWDNQTLENLLSAAPLMIGAEYLDLAFMTRLWQEMNQGFNRGIGESPLSVSEYLHGFSPHIHLAGRVYFHLVERKDDTLPFQFLATYTPEAANPGKHRPLHWALEAHRDNPEQLLELLTTVHAAARSSHLLKTLLDSGELFHHLAWDAGEAFEFLKQLESFEQAGIICRIPDWWKKKGGTPSLKISLGGKPPSVVGIEALVSVDVALFLGDDPLTEEEIKTLLNQTQGLAWIKNRWIEVDRERLQKLLHAYETAMGLMGNRELSIFEALQLQLHPHRLTGSVDTVLPDLQIGNGEWLEQVFSTLKNPGRINEIKPDKNFLATLRPYQQIGLNWLAFLDSLGFGACLADDMGLGKTIQVLAFLSTLKAREPGQTSLLVVPASLLSNWEAEIHRFFPDLDYFMEHPGYKKTGQSGKNPLPWEKFDLVITTYAMVQRNTSLQQFHWRTLILDEAQAIKNPSTRQSKTVKRLHSDTRIAMTGTPIENALSDLWSLFDFMNPGLLGNIAEFKAFSKKLKKEPAGYARLKQVVSPYILRRMKTDKRIAPELPDKLEMRTFPELSKKQRVLYIDFAAEIEKRLEDADDGIQRKGLVLSALMKFKQICNHPDQYLGTGNFVPADSGKFIRLGEICDTIHSKRERVLVFTQFKEMVSPLQTFLSTVFQHQGGIIHGGINIKKRQEAIDKFQGRAYCPFMVLSLKAGGTGLNLTRANHVIHFDRWWNPAVENQATDRAFRIGQTRKVIVHKFISRGTIEEKIDLMIEQKKKLAEEIISDSQGTWVTAMDNRELMELFTLKI